MSSKTEQADPKGRAVRFSDDQLTEIIRKSIVTEGFLSPAAWLKDQRSKGQGSNDQRVRRAWNRARVQHPEVEKLLATHEAEVKAQRDEERKERKAAKAEAGNGNGTEPETEPVAKAATQQRVSARRARKATGTRKPTREATAKT